MEMSPKPRFFASRDRDVAMIFRSSAIQPCSDKGLPKQGGAPYLELCSCQTDRDSVEQRAFSLLIRAKVRIVVRRASGFPADSHTLSGGRVALSEKVEIQCRPVMQPLVGPNSRGVRREPSVSVPYE